MIPKSQSVELRLVIPSEEKPSGFLRIFNYASIEGCFLPISIIFLIVLVFRRIFNLASSNQKKSYLLLDTGKLVVHDKGVIDEFLIKELKDIQIHYNSENYIEDSDFVKYSKVQFEFSNKLQTYFFSSGKSAYIKMCKLLYDGHIQFKEYRNEKRVFLGKPKNYKQIQEIKSKYGVDW